VQAIEKETSSLTAQLQARQRITSRMYPRWVGIITFLALLLLVVSGSPPFILHTCNPQVVGTLNIRMKESFSDPEYFGGEEVKPLYRNWKPKDPKDSERCTPSLFEFVLGEAPLASLCATCLASVVIIVPGRRETTVSLYHDLSFVRTKDVRFIGSRSKRFSNSKGLPCSSSIQLYIFSHRGAR
jgi:hypothetical protein